MGLDFDGVDDGFRLSQYTVMQDLMKGQRDTIFCWFNARSDGQGNVGKLIGSSPDSNVNHRQLSVGNESGGNVNIDFLAAWDDTDGQWVTAVDIALNVWHSVGCDYDDTDVNENANMWVDGITDSLTEEQTPVGLANDNVQHCMMGCRKDQNAGRRTHDGLLAHGAMWTGVLSTVEHAALGNGVHPFVIRNDTLVLYTPLHGNETTEPNYPHMAQQGTITEAVKGPNPNVELLENYL